MKRMGVLVVVVKEPGQRVSTGETESERRVPLNLSAALRFHPLQSH